MKRKWVLSLLFTILLIGCQSDPKADRSFITQKPCTAPCWYGLRINQSGEEDVLKTLTSLEFIQKDSIKKEEEYTWQNDNKAIMYWFNCSHPYRYDCGDVVFSNGKLKLIMMAINYGLNIKQTTELYGIPKYVDYGDDHPESHGCYIDFQWPERNIIATYVSSNNRSFCNHIRVTNFISPQTPISSVLYITDEGFMTEPACCTRILHPSLDP